MRTHVYLAVLLSFGASVQAKELAPAAAGYEESVRMAIGQAKDNAGELTKALAECAKSPDELEAMSFLVANMPEKDLKSLKANYLVENVRLAIKARDAFSWGKSIPKERWLNDVLPYASVNERRDAWRKDFLERFTPVVKDCKTAAEAGHKLNLEMFKMVKVKYSTKRKKPDQSPYESMEQGLASCTGLSILLTNACRSVGVPARLAGTPLWSNKRGNHTWVEIWDAKWHFAGACEADKKGLDRGWFVGAASKADPTDWRHMIYATSWKKTDLHFPMVWKRGSKEVKAEDVTARYVALGAKKAAAKAVEVSINVFAKGGKERVKTHVEIRDAAGKSLAKGETRDGSNDTNDFLMFKLAPGAEIAIELSWNDGNGAMIQQFEKHSVADANEVLRFVR